MAGVRDIRSRRSAPVCRSRPLLMGPWNCTSLQTCTKPLPGGQQAWVAWELAAPGGKGAKRAAVQSWDGYLQRKISGADGGAGGTGTAVLGLSAGLDSAKKGFNVHLDNRGFVQSAPKHRSSFAIFSF